MASIEERVSRLEGGYDHLATKADIADVKTEIGKSEAATIRWMIGLVGVFAASLLPLTTAGMIRGETMRQLPPRRERWNKGEN